MKKKTIVIFTKDIDDVKKITAMENKFKKLGYKVVSVPSEYVDNIYEL